MVNALVQDEYLIRRKVLSLLGQKFHVYDSDHNLLLYTKQKAFKLKEDIRIYSDESMSEELLSIQARQMIDFSAAYDVIDVQEGKKVGALRRKGLRSILRDSWEFLDEHDNSIGKIEEDSMGMALLRRFLSNLIPQRFSASNNGTDLASFRQDFNPFIFRLRVQMASGADERIDPRLVLAGGILLAAIEGRQGD